MKKMFSYLAILTVVVIVMMSTSTINASADTGRGLYGPSYSRVGTAYLTDPDKAGYILLSVSSSPDVTEEFLDQLDQFCSVVDFLNLSDFVPGCSYVNTGKAFYKYVNKGMQIDIEYLNPDTGEVIWSGTLEDGSIMYLGSDHTAYDIYIKSHGLSYPWTKLIMLDNITWVD